MTHRFPLKEIARQSGLSTATVDRAMNNRAHVSPQTKARVAAALIELEGQEAQLSAKGRRLFFDFVIEAPARFSREVKRAAEQVLPHIGAAVCRPRFIMKDVMSEPEIEQTLTRIAKRGSQGVCLKVRDLAGARAAVDRLCAAGIPVVTLVTDLTGTQRGAYAGLDNQSAGRTAAYLLSKTVKDRAGAVLTSKSNDRFLGEEEREVAFTNALRDFCPHLTIVDVSGQHAAGERHRFLRTLRGLDRVCAVYSMGGGNQGILDGLDACAMTPDIYVAHDLDHENRSLMAQGRLDFVLYHDLRHDLENVFRAFLHHHKLVADRPSAMTTHIQVITPLNLPPP